MRFLDGFRDEPRAVVGPCSGLEKNHDFLNKKNQIFLFKSDFFYLNQIFLILFVQASNTRGWQIAQMLYDDVINDKDYVGFKSVTDDRDLRKYIRR